MNLYVYIEILNREFLSKLIISMESASKGINVYLGRIKPYLERDFSYPVLSCLNLSLQVLKELNNLNIINQKILSLQVLMKK